MSEKFKPFCAVYLILMNKKNEILLSKRENTGFQDGLYGLPSGHVEAGESLTQAIVRESTEEINIQPLDPTFAHVLYRGETANNGRTYIDTYFISKSYNGEINNNEPSKCADLSWFAIDQLPTETIPYIRLVIERIQNGQYFSELYFD
jgi:8-oxo-dGTP diphosphatase